jgi:hypothetical protein
MAKKISFYFNCWDKPQEPESFEHPLDLAHFLGVKFKLGPMGKFSLVNENHCHFTYNNGVVRVTQDHNRRDRKKV